MEYLIFILAPLYILIVITNNPIMSWVDKWACTKEKRDVDSR